MSIVWMILFLVSANYWAWVFSKKESVININVEAPKTPTVYKGNVETLDFPTREENGYGKKQEVPLPDPASMMKKAPKTSFGSRAKSGE
jgi:hypothetical protein